MENVVEVKNLIREYQSHKGIFKRENVTTRAVDDISFDIKKGEVFGLLGPNGAGKTTTIKILTTLLAPTSGDVSVLGYKPFGEETKLRPLINFIYGGERSLYWRISARENLEYFSDLYKIPPSIQKSRITELLELVKLTERADERVETYSKGMKQRLQIARGLVNDPHILFLDEPTIGLDPVGAKDLRDIIQGLKANGKTILLTTHYMHEADELCDRIAIINKGKLVALDTPSELKKVVDGLSVIELEINSKASYLEALKKLNGVKVVEVKHGVVNQTYTVQFKGPFNLVSDILELMKNEEIINLHTRTTTLEDVYVHYVGEKK
ncbi:ABC transporter ATP-binding protein [Viridibacillus arvi]|uniref:ABC transporter ATP-binding protein n=1 Tax=Viridibacillus arvi TaxID=263475 RepID=UPI0034CD24E6